MKLDKLRESLERSPVVKMGDYSYFVNPITDGVPSVDPLLLAEVVDGVKDLSSFRCDIILTPEAMGIPIAVPLSMSLGIPYTIVRKKRYGLPGEMLIEQSTGYSKSELFMNGISRGCRVVIVDSVVSTGGTLSALIKALREAGAEIVDVVVIVEKGDGRQSVEKETGIKVKTMVRVEISDGKVRVLN
jgi:adenine phosphoribosyltransferase